jgi:hypothetical protein
MAVRHSGMRGVFVTLVCGMKRCCLVKSLMYCSREVGMVALIETRSTSCVMLGKKKSSMEREQGVCHSSSLWLFD